MNTELKVGMFTIVGIFATLLAIFTLSPNLFDRQEKSEYFTVLDDASGILPKTHVRTNGVNIGEVKAVDLTENATKIWLQVDAGVLIPEGSTTIVRTVGFLGDKYIEISRPSSSKAKLQAGSYIPQDRNTNDISDVIQLLGSVAADVKEVTQNLASVLGDAEGEATIAEIVENLRGFSSSMRGAVDDNRNDLRELVANLKSVSDALKTSLRQENVERLDRILANFDESMVEVRGATKNIKLISEKVERGEGTIGKLVNEDDTLDEIEGAIKDLREVLSPIRELEVGVSTHVEMRSQTADQTYFNLVLRTRPDTYYLLGLSDVSKQIVDTTTETLPAGEGDPNATSVTRVRETVKEDSSLRFNLQIAKRWWWLGARIGLFESTGGVAADAYFLNDSLRLSVEIFDFEDSEDTNRRYARLKTYLSALFFNHIYMMIGVDDITRYKPGTETVDPKLNYYGGLGLTFTDKDLKTIFGAAALGGTGI
jgi:phospholipid/cholesterol/gamma-HCH transport system substrate-binding protein